VSDPRESMVAIAATVRLNPRCGKLETRAL
jgi:hypothetical protein